MDDGLELRVCQNPQKVVQDEEEFGREHVTVFDLERTQCEEDVTNNEDQDSGRLIVRGSTVKKWAKIQSYSAFKSNANATLVGDETERRAAEVLIVSLDGVRLNPKTLPVDFFKCQHLIGKKYHTCIFSEETQTLW